MNTLIFLDTETTEIKDPRLVQLGYIAEGEKVDCTFKPVNPITIGAMAINHITNEEVAGYPLFEGSKEKKALQDLIDDGGIIVAHNAPFDVRVLEAEGIRVGRSIDTRRCAMHLYDYDGRYSLQELRYALGLYRRIDNENALAHDAMGDVIILKELYLELASLARVELTVDYLLKLSTAPVLIKKVMFGKYSPTGTHAPVDKEFYTWEDIAKIDPEYMHWLRGSEGTKSKAEQNEDLLHTLNHYLNACAFITVHWLRRIRYPCRRSRNENGGVF